MGHLGVHLYFYQTLEMDSYVYTEFCKPFSLPSDSKSWLLIGITWRMKRGNKEKKKKALDGTSRYSDLVSLGPGLGVSRLIILFPRWL